jgi:putative transposase
MRRAFKYRVLANKQTLERAECWLDLCRDLYNVALEQRITIYRQNKGRISCYEQINQLPELKKAFPEYKQVGSQVLVDVIRRLDKAYQAFFRRFLNGEKPGFPRFKSKSRYDSFTLTWIAGWKLDGKYLTIRNVGRFKIRLSRPVVGRIKLVTLRSNAAGTWYVCFTCDDVPERKLKDSLKEVGIDVGVRSFLVDSNGEKVDNPLYFRQAEAILRRRQRIYRRREDGSNRRQKAKVLAAKTYDKMVAQRNDFLHKLANRYIAEFGRIFIEDLNINGMVENSPIRNRHLSKSIFDSSWGTFFRFLSYKAEGAGRQVVRVNPKGTSQICSRCGEKVEKTLAERTHHCPYCGLVLDRDHNSAINVLQVGQTCQELTYAVAQSTCKAYSEYPLIGSAKVAEPLILP